MKLQPIAMARFNSRIEMVYGGCWEWRSFRLPAGYGVFKHNGKMLKAHRVSYALFNGPIPSGLMVCHRCDNPGCVNPLHLFVGNGKDNMRDATRKGRMKGPTLTAEKRQQMAASLRRHYAENPGIRRGSRNSHALLTEEQVEVIRRRYAAGGVSQSTLAAEYRVAQTTIGAIVRKVNWK